jgi:hypothetical protein
MGHNFVHIEIVHPDPEAAAQFMCDVLGGKRVERKIAGQIEGVVPGIKLAHVLAGNLVFQFVKPNEALASWSEQLQTSGPGVHNVSLTISDIEDVRAAMEERGGKVLMGADVDLKDSLGYEGEDTFKTYVIDCREQTGLRFEIFDERCGWVGGQAP